jgi:hypothetical protein
MKKLFVIYIVLFLVGTVTIPGGNYEENSMWWIDRVDDEGNTGRYTSIDLDSQGFAHISYCREDAKGFVKYAYWNDTGWVIKTIDQGLEHTYGNVLTTSIVLDVYDHPHIAYTKPPDSVEYAWWNGEQWIYETVYTDQGIYGSIGIDLDCSGHPHISFCDGLDAFMLHYVYFNGSEWNHQIIDSTPHTGFHNSIMIDGNDGIHIAYTNINQKKINYAYKESDLSDWIKETVDDSILEMPAYPSIDIDTSGCPHIGYFDAGGQQNTLNYAYKESKDTLWITDTVISDTPVGNSYSLALNDNDYPFLMYQQLRSKDLELLYWNGTTWDSEIIDTEGMVGCCSNMVVQSNDLASICYRDEKLGDLKYAFKNKVPTKPEVNGPGEAKIQEEIDFSIVSTDENNHQVKYMIKWDEEGKWETYGPFPSGQQQTLSHKWSEEGQITIKIRAKDVFDGESEEAMYHLVLSKRKPVLNIVMEFLRMILHEIFIVDLSEWK